MDGNFVRCELCGEYFERIQWTHLRFEHGITTDQYTNLFPGSPLVSKTIKQSVSEWASSRNVSSETRAKLSLHRHANPVRNNPMLDFEKWSEMSQELWANSEYREARVKEHREGWTPERREEYRQRSLRQFDKPGVRQAASEKAKALWRDPTYYRSQMDSRKSHPNGDELYLMSLLDKHFYGEWRYVGDFEVVIGGKSPDFININGKKEVIELFSYYWHLERARTDNDEADRIQHYGKYGFDCLVLWTDEIYNEEFVVSKVREFVG